MQLKSEHNLIPKIKYICVNTKEKMHVCVRGMKSEGVFKEFKKFKL